MRLQGALLAVGVPVTVVVCLVAFWNPVVGVLALVLAAFIFWACYQPYKAALTLAFLSAAFPKAGVKVGTFPFPVFLLGLLVAVLLVAKGRRKVEVRRGAGVWLLIFVVYVLVKALVFLPSGLSAVAPYVAWAAIPVVILWLATQISEPIPQFRRALESGFIVAALFGVIQYVGGLEATAIPGLTIAYGDSYESKNNVIFAADGADFSKIPSTYQNGNIFGVTAAVFLTLALMRISTRTATKLDVAVLIGAAVSIFFSGSRTAIIGAVVGIILIAMRRGRLSRKIAAVVVIVGGAWVAVTLQPGLAERYSVDNLVTSGGAGRSEIWRAAMNDLSPTQILFGTTNYISHEGWVGMVEQIGLVGILLLVITVIALTSAQRAIRPVLIVLFVCAAIDSSYQLFPTWFIPAALAVSQVIFLQGKKERLVQASKKADTALHV